MKGRAAPIPKTSKHTVFIDEVGMFVRDTYDFTGDQPLGFWNFSTGEVSKLPGFSYSYVENETFRKWRGKNHMGGDFLVLSDVKRTKLTPPHSFIVDG